jgi:hypothetical protein
MSAAKRKVKSLLATSPGLISQLSFNEPAVGNKNLAIGPFFSVFKGSCTTPTRIGARMCVYCFNNSSAPLWVNVGDETVSVSASFTGGIPIPPFAWFPLGMGDNTHIITSSANVGVYLVDDNIVLE